ncbi:hypothetical protein QAD02_012257 [Eretmocerus hayati]|uniref:Uncharacterized protein n=1 Tax=Eretmocerus hayati TaxID=131215 RepID=A0ACC2P3X1_9HYME|nr:hypothetical protein QAD02_012257 [Eretmocerus hayati]
MLVGPDGSVVFSADSWTLQAADVHRCSPSLEQLFSEYEKAPTPVQCEPTHPNISRSGPTTSARRARVSRYTRAPDRRVSVRCSPRTGKYGRFFDSGGSDASSTECHARGRTSPACVPQRALVDLR